MLNRRLLPRRLFGGLVEFLPTRLVRLVTAFVNGRVAIAGDDEFLAAGCVDNKQENDQGLEIAHE